MSEELKPDSSREAILRQAILHTCGERDRQYGPPYFNLSDCADLWTTYLCCKFAGSAIDSNMFTLSAEDVAHMHVLSKMARTFSGKYLQDTYEDAAAYAAIAGECADIARSQE